jgi:phosphoribosylanthranilate isomerase
LKRARLKVCGITSLEDAKAAIECGADFLGFNFYDRSPRYVSPASAKLIIDSVADVTAVGVFVNSESAEVLRIMEETGVNLAQLHGDESPEFCQEIGAERVIKALRIDDEFDERDVLKYPSFAILLDTYDKSMYGGTGRVTNWGKAREAANLTRVILAGGLSPDNIVAAMLEVKPFAVDVNSGVESAPGRKDANKLQQLRVKMNG